MDISCTLENSHGCSCGEHSQRDAISTDLSYCLHDHSDSHDFQTGSNDYKSRYHQLVLEKEEMERCYEKERRERQAAEQKFQQELDEKSLIEDQFSSLNRNLERYEGDLNLLRSENQILKGQFDSLKGAISSSMNSGSVFSNSTYFGQASSPVVPPVMTAESVEMDSYKHEVAVLANENDLFRQIIEIIKQQSQEKASWDEKMSEKCNIDNSFRDDQEVTRLQEECSKLKSRIRDLERSRREQESEMEEVTLDFEDKTRKYKKDISKLEEEMHSKNLLTKDLERQLHQLSIEYQEEIQKWELKIEAEILMKTQIQEEVNVLQSTVQNLEIERMEMVTKLEDLYNSENNIIEARNDLGARFSEEIAELQIRLEGEIRSKIELSQEMTVLMNEFFELRNKSKQMEEMYVSEIEALRLNLGVGTGEGAILQSGCNSNNTSGAYLTQQQKNTLATHQRLPQKDTEQVRNNIQIQLNQEIQKREALEKENKELLYKMKSILSNSDHLSGGKTNQPIDIDYKEFSNDTNVQKSDSSSHFRKEIRALENRVAELTDECETLQHSVKKGREVEKKNRELIDELDELSSERDGMLRKLKTLGHEVEKSSFSLQDLVDKNRRLMDDIDLKSRRIRDMEDTFRHERYNLIRSYDREKSLEINDISRKKEDVEKRLENQIRENRILENKVRDLENEIYHLKKNRDQTHFGNMTNESNIEDGNGRRSNLDNSRFTINQSVGGLEQELEKMLQERKQIEEDHLKTLEEQRIQMREEFEIERQKLRQCFEDEKCDLANRFAGGGSHGIPTVGAGQFNHSSVNADGNFTQIGQLSHAVSQNTRIMHPIIRQPFKQKDMDTHQHYSFYGKTHLNQNRPQEVPSSNYPTSQQSQGYVSFQNQQPTLQRQLPYPQHYSGQSNQGEAYPQTACEIHQDSQLNENLNRLQQEVQRLNIEKQNMEKRIKDMEIQMGSRLGNVTSTTPAAVGESTNNQKENISSNTGDSCGDIYDITHERSYHTSTNMENSTTGKLDGRLQVTMKKLVEEHRQHSDELKRQITLQKDSFEKEKLKMQKEYTTLLNNIKCLKNEIHILKHERENMRDKLKRQYKETQQHEERFRDEIMTVRKEYEMKMKQEIEKSARTVSDLQKKISASERTLKEIEVKFRNEVTLVEKKYSQEKMNLESKLRETENLMTSRLKYHYQAKLNTEKEKYENTLKELRKEIKYLQEQRKKIQLKLSHDVTDTGYRDTFQNKDYYKRFEKDFETRFVKEKGALEDTIRNLRKEVHELTKKINDTKSLYKEQMIQKEEQFEREKQRIEERNRNDIYDLKRQISKLQDDNFKSRTMHRISYYEQQKNNSMETPHTAIQKRNTSVQLKNNELENDITHLKKRLSDLESRQTKILLSQNDKSTSFSGRKVRFDGVNSSKDLLRRSLSSTDLGDMTGSAIPVNDATYSKGKRGVSRDDLGISSSRLGTDALAWSSGSLAGYQDLKPSRVAALQGRRNMEITYIPSTGILNGTVSQGLRCSGMNLRSNLDFPSNSNYRGTSLGGNSTGSTLRLSSGKDVGTGSSLLSGNFYSNRSSGFLSGNRTDGSSVGFLSGNTGGSSGGIFSGNGAGESRGGQGLLSGSGAGGSSGGVLYGSGAGGSSGGVLSGIGAGGSNAGILFGSGGGASNGGVLSGGAVGSSSGGSSSGILSGSGASGLSGGILSGNIAGEPSGSFLSGDSFVSGNGSGSSSRILSSNTHGNGISSGYFTSFRSNSSNNRTSRMHSSLN